ncbi:hypothetical protein CH251_10435 [Rhodococcus sp. 06-462-5]|uniref:glycosyltransferase n=1 Tax=unclassified Rhodococcus (in: high G+C Gram-positive bacteria) TaxID=192944 RepID=UPI000B9A2915|nr:MULTISPECIES: glycosyltransferase [unclassified Rhodococcus (in: high G+C Gram-positive bacteria)]OZC75185.1 hypothetical protein CH251_10435 [Rhodococcus sp. 06-462-5]OZE67702.1 hypothetical protein CH270_08030 [Rhodococcus sp. 02-925g]
MKILHLVPLIGANAEYGGPARGTIRQAIALTDRSHSVTVLSLWKGLKPEGPANAGVELVTFPAHQLPILPGFGGLVSIAALNWLRHNVRNFDVVHIHGGREVWILNACRIILKAGVPFVIQTHGMLNPRKTKTVQSYDSVMTQRAYAPADAALYLTNYEERQLNKWNWMPRTELVLNGVDDPAMQLPVGIGDGRLRVVTTARIHPRKHMPDLVAAVSKLLQQNIQISLDIYGPDEGDVVNVEAAISRNGVQDSVRYCGPLAYGEVRSALSRYNAYVLPSRHEPFPNSLLEALATGLPSICTEECGIAPYLEANHAGIVVQHGADGIAQGLKRLAEEPNLRHELGQNALDLCNSTFSMSAVAERLEEIYLQSSRSDRNQGARL